MHIEKAQQLHPLIHIGRVLMSEAVAPQLEAFPGNALYCGRGMLPMNKYKTVKEVCDLTGLTRKHLYYFHHAKVVQAVAYANYSVEGNDGYKLYDDDRGIDLIAENRLALNLFANVILYRATDKADFGIIYAGKGIEALRSCLSRSCRGDYLITENYMNTAS